MPNKTFQKSDGEIIQIPDEFNLKIDETSNNVYQLDLTDELGRKVSDHGTNLDQMVINSIQKLKSFDR